MIAAIVNGKKDETRRRIDANAAETRKGAAVQLLQLYGGDGGACRRKAKREKRNAETWRRRGTEKKDKPREEAHYGKQPCFP